jgi:uncharacterized protein YciI
MKFLILFEDSPTADPGIRGQYMPAHLAFLERHADRIKVAGPLRTPSGDGAGGAWIVEADDEAAADTLVRTDPFWPTGLRQSYRILAWKQVYADGQRLIDVR